MSNINSGKKNKSGGFTLAETLLTLTALSVIAALTIPGIVHKYKEFQLNTTKKKAKTTLAMGYIKMPVTEKVVFSELPIFGCEGDFSCLSEAHRKIFLVANERANTSKGLPARYINSSQTDYVSFDWKNIPYIYTTSDGITYGVDVNKNDKIINIVTDLNSKGTPNRVGKDLLKFHVDKNGELFDVTEELDTIKNMNSDIITIIISDTEGGGNAEDNPYDVIQDSKP